jgi:glycosyltransferase involved in cell wall biosynthesis/ADP-heptose:LPS heptosyltransferase
VRECSIELAEACPDIDEVIVNHREPMIHDQNYTAEFIKRIRAAKFDVVICPIYSRDKVTDFITANSQASERIVSAGNDSNMPLEQIQANNPYFTSIIPVRAGIISEMERNKEFLKGLGVVIDQPLRTTIWIEQEHRDFADGLLRELNIEKPIVVCPFAQHQMRDWPIHKWAQLISNHGDYPILICGSKQNSQTAENIIEASEHPRVHNLCGKTSLRQLAALLDRAKLCVGVESAPAHIAATVDCPHVVIIGGGHFGRFMPYSPKTTLVYHKMDCYGCNWRCKYGQDIRCINAITVDMVEQAFNNCLKIPTESFTQNQKTSYKQPEEEYLVSAIISTYNSEKFIRGCLEEEKFIRGCLEDLENQTIAEKLEIIIVNSGSQQNEEAIVRDFQRRYNNIKYIKTEERETIYKSWNRGIKAASGKYITNANTDDRHRQNSLEIMARALDENPNKVLVYANQLDVDEIDGRRVTVGERINGEFSKGRLFKGQCPPGSQPMWRKEVHNIFGHFDESFSVGGDYEFWFRLTQKFDFLYLNEILGERYIGPGTLSNSNTNLTCNLENMVIHKSYKYALQEAITIGATGISEHPIFSKWPEVNIWKQNTKAKLEDRQMSLIDNIKDTWDHRTNPAPKLTFVVVTYNRHKDLLENLYALNEQSEKDFEVIVVDNGGELSWLKQYADEFMFGLSGIELEFNFGPSPARNIGTKFAKAEYIAFLDDDVVADKNLVRNIVKHFTKSNISGLRGKVLPKSQADSEDIPDNYDLGDQTITTACEVSCLSVFRKDVLVKTGGFDELLFGPEGMELSYRICKAQKEKVKSILYFPDVIVYHTPCSKGPARTEQILRQERMELLAWRKDHDIIGYKELVYSLYPASKGIFEDKYENYQWLINVALHLHKNFPEEAVEWAEKGVALRPDGFKGCYILGFLYTWFGRYDDAIILLERIYEPLQNSVMSNGNEFICSEFKDQVDICECYLSMCTQLAQCYMQTNQYEKVKQIYSELLNNPNLTIPKEQKADVRNALRSLDKTSSIPAITKNKAIVSAKSEVDYLVSAIVSTYNSEKFLRGCLEDLEHQTIAEKLEIIVVNSGSQENEEAIVHEYQQKYDNIVYIKTEQQEGLYTAWNRAVKVARGTFLTNANTDDRHRDDALEIMAEILLANPDAALVYGDQICTDTPNATFADHHATNMTKRPEYSHERLLFGCCVGSQPMWRKTFHKELGYFDETLTCAGDWDFWLRISSKYKFKHIPEFLGLYFYNENGIEHGKKIHSLYERYIVGKRYGNPYISVIPLYHSKSNPLVSVIMPAYNAAEYIAEAIESILIQNYRNFELIVVDDGSTDNTKDIVSGFKDDKIIYFYKNNGGPSGARNLAIKKAKGQYIMPLDADDMMTPDSITSHLVEFEKHPDVDLVYSDVLLIDENSTPIRMMNKSEYQDRRYLIRDLFRAGHPIVPFRLGIRRSVFDKIGFYDEDLLIGEDYDMMRRFVKARLKPHHLSEPLHLRRMHTGSLSRNHSAQKVKFHFEVIRRFTDTFTYDELFPDVAWDEIAPDTRQLHAKCLTAGTYLALGHEYIKSNAPEFSRSAFDRACSELNECTKMDPKNQSMQQLFQKSKRIRAKYTKAARRAVPI